MNVHLRIAKPALLRAALVFSSLCLWASCSHSTSERPTQIVLSQCLPKELPPGLAKEILEHALSLTKDSYGPYTLQFSKTCIRPYDLAHKMPADISIGVYVGQQPLAANVEFLPFPLQRGLQGARLIVSGPKLAKAMAQAKSTHDLARFSVCSVVNWWDNKIFEHAGIAVEEYPTLEKAYAAIAQGHPCFISRAAIEALDEKRRFASHFLSGALVTNSFVSLNYPFDFFFFVAHGNTRLKERLHFGFSALAKSGEWERMLENQFAPALQTWRAGHRRTLKLDNPDLLSDPEVHKRELWMSL